MEQQAYLASNLNVAFVESDDSVVMVSGNENTPNKMFDGYQKSQIRLLQPEIKAIGYSSIEDLKNQIKDNNQNHELLKMALEIMDPALSREYRQEISNILSQELEIHPLAIEFINNRFLSTVLPNHFQPDEAALLLEKSSSIRSLYEDLRLKSKCFEWFYTSLRLLHMCDVLEQEHLDATLTDHGFFASFTTSVFHRSRELYQETVNKVVQELAGQFPAIDAKLFDQIQESISVKYQVKFNNLKTNFNFHRYKSDPIANYLITIRNAQLAKQKIVKIPASNLKKRITEILYQKGYILKYKFENNNNQGIIKIALKYHPESKKPAIQRFEKISRQALKMYPKPGEFTGLIKKVGIAIIATPEGVMTFKEAEDKNLSGRPLFIVR